MVERQDNWSAADVTPWVWVRPSSGANYGDAVHGQIAAANSGDYLVYTLDSAGLIGVTGAGPTYTFQLDAPHGYGVFELFAVNVNYSSGTVDHLIAVATSATEFDVTITAYSPGSTGTVYFNSKGSLALPGPGQRADCIVSSRGQSANHTFILWGRFDERGGPTGGSVADVDRVSRGYGVALTWNLDGTRSLQLVKIDYETGLVVTLGDAITVELKKVGDTDLGSMQWLRLILVDEPIDSELGQSQGVMIRAYLNEKDDGAPTLETVDRGVSDAGVSTAIHRAGGTWALVFGFAADIEVDAFYGTDGYVLPDYGDTGSAYSTLAELRSEVEALCSLGGRSGFTNSVFDPAIRNTISQIIRRGGDKASPIRKLRLFSLTGDASFMVRMPVDVGRILNMWSSSGTPLTWDLVGHDHEKAQLIIGMSPNPTGGTYWVDYIERVRPMVNDTDRCSIPSEYDDVISYGAALRILEIDGPKNIVENMRNRYDETLREMLMHFAQIHRMRHPQMRTVGQHRGRSRYGKLTPTGYLQGY